MNEKFEKEIVEIVSTIIEIPAEEIDLEASFMDDYGLDSLRALEILAAIENQYEITINPERLKDMTNLNNVIKVTKDFLDMGTEEYNASL